MSGGSYNYLCHKDAEALLNSTADLESMIDRLAGLGYAEDAAVESQNLLLTLRQFRVRMDTSINRLSEVWRSVEWWDSNDSGEDTVKAALEKYREK